MIGLTMVHIVFGSAALLAGAAGLTVRKGSPLHARAGTAFFVAMLVMAGTGAAMAALKPERGTALIGLFTAYLVVTSWMTARRRSGEAGRFELYGLVFALGVAALMLAFGLMAAASPTGRLDSLPPGAHYPFAFLAALAAALDLNFILRGRLGAAQRIARHLWRMCAALLIAALSFFLGQQDEFPQAWQGAFIWFLPPLSVLAAMLFWIFRVRFARAWRRPRPKPAMA